MSLTRTLIPLLAAACILIDAISARAEGQPPTVVHHATSAPVVTLCVPSRYAVSAVDLAKDQTIVAGRLVTLGAAGSQVVSAGDRCLNVTLQDVTHEKKVVDAVRRAGYVALADSGHRYLDPGARVTLVCRKRGCAPGAATGRADLRSARPTLQVVVPMKFVQRGSASVSVDSTGHPAVIYTIKGKGSIRWCRFTHRVGTYVAVVLDNTVLSDPIIEQAICGGQTQITGLANAWKARILAAYLNSGPLAVPLVRAT